MALIGGVGPKTDTEGNVLSAIMTMSGFYKVQTADIANGVYIYLATNGLQTSYQKSLVYQEWELYHAMASLDDSAGNGKHGIYIDVSINTTDMQIPCSLVTRRQSTMIRPHWSGITRCCYGLKLSINPYGGQANGDFLRYAIIYRAV